MNITNIKESGASNILKWAITNGADLQSDIQLQSLINDETFYLVEISNVNFLEVFRLSQLYREKLKIVKEELNDIPPVAELREMFTSASITPEGESPVPMIDLAEYSARKFMDIMVQMHSDDDIIRPEVARLFTPMLCRRYVVQIPVSFVDLISGAQSPSEASSIFNNDYPNTLTSIIEAEHSGIRNALYLGLLKSTSIVRYQQRYEQLVKLTKYSHLNKVNSDELYKFRMIGFYKYDNISHGQARCDMFQGNRESIAQTMKKLAYINTPLKVEFVIQLPIHYMQMLLNSFSREDLPVSYESSMSSIIDAGIVFNEYKSHEYDEESEDPEVQAKITEYNNSIKAYQTRISEANQTTLNAISMMINSGEEVDITSVFALLPSIYMTKAVITMDISKIDKYHQYFSGMMDTMITDMSNMVKALNTDIAGYKNK